MLDAGGVGGDLAEVFVPVQDQVDVGLHDFVQLAQVLLQPLHVVVGAGVRVLENLLLDLLVFNRMNRT